MKNPLFIYCITNSKLSLLEELNYNLVGVGKKKFSKKYIDCSTGDNIQDKEEHYSELTFHYWFWKNMLNQIPDDQWIGFCAYRRFWSNNKKKVENNNIYKTALNSVPEEWNNYDAIIGDHQSLETVKWIKVIKYGKIAFLRNPLVFLKNKRYNNHFTVRTLC